MRIKTWAALLGGLVILTAPRIGAAQQQRASVTRGVASQEDAIKREVRHVLVMLPRYTVFDNLAFSVSGDHVTLLGQVTNPTIKSDAEAAVKGVEGVGSVDDQIEVLPLSPDDDQIRRAELRAMFAQPSLERYAEGAVSPIHIIVKNGRVTLEGAVSSQEDKDLASIQAKGVPDVFSVTNNLTVQPDK